MAYTESADKQRSISRSVALNNSVLYWQGRPGLNPENVLLIADIFLEWLTRKEPTEQDKQAEAIVGELVKKHAETPPINDKDGKPIKFITLTKESK